MNIDLNVNCIINSLKVIPSSENLLVHFRDNQILIISIHTQKTILKLKNFLNEKMNLKSTIDTSGTNLYCPNEDGRIKVFDLLTGEERLFPHVPIISH
jgi:hypothetical protein